MNNPKSEDEPSTSSSSSRRKPVFRMPLPVMPRAVSSPAHTTIEEKPETDGEISIDANSSTSDNKKRKANPWSFDEVCAFFEGVKIHGKDFDGIMKAMSKRKVEKTKEHVKTFFFNSVKTYKSMLSITDEEMINVSKDARELFILVNACEWKRKTMNMKVNIEKMKELLFEGVVNVRVGRKVVNIKTPPCPALCRYFAYRKADKIPNDIYVHLEPMRNEDHFYLRTREHNPFLRVKLNSNDRIVKLLDFLHRKWSVNEDASNVSITLWPDSSCEVASLNISTVETSPFISLSLNKLKKHLDDTKERMEPVKKIPANQLQTAAEVNTKTKPSLTVIYPKPFTLTDNIIADGITNRNIQNSILAELFCVCGRKSPIQLRYQIHYDQPVDRVPEVEPWKLMIELLNRGYGESLTTSRKEEERDRKREMREAIAAEPASKKKKADVDVPSTSQAPIPAQTMASDIVERENEAFEHQLAMLRKTQRQRTVPAKRKNTNAPVISTGTPPINVRPAVSSPTPPGQCAPKPFMAPTCTVILSKQKASQNPVRAIGQPAKKHYESASSASGAPSTSGPPGASTSGPPKNAPTDFSSVVFSPAKKHVDAEIQRKRTSDFLSSLQTPTDTPLQTPNRRAEMMQQLFGDDLSMSPSSTRHASMLEAPHSTNKETSVVDFTDMMYQHISKDHGDMTMSNPGLDFSVSEVQQTYQDMMSSSQDSHDYIFQQFQKKKATPKKK